MPIASQNAPTFRFGNHSDVGRVREKNEDYMGYFETLNGHLFIVCDGMGGHLGGSTASQIAVNSIRGYLQQQIYASPEEAIYSAVQYANQRIYQESQVNPELRGMGTTCVLALVRGNLLYYAHVGDSRLYYSHQGNLRRLTKDHSFVQALIDQGVLSDQEAETHPRRNELLRALGTHGNVDVDLGREPIVPYRDDVFLLCSDGLNAHVSDGEIASVLRDEFLSVQHKALKLVEMANMGGGEDNITVQIIDFHNATHSPPSQSSYQSQTVSGSSVPISQTNPMVSKSTTKPSVTNEKKKISPRPKSRSQKDYNPPPISNNKSNFKLSGTGNLTPFFILIPLAFVVGFLYFNPNNNYVKDILGERYFTGRNDTTRNSFTDRVKRKAFEKVKEEFPLLRDVIETAEEVNKDYKELKEDYQDVKEKWEKVKKVYRKGRETIDDITDKYEITKRDLMELNGVDSEEALDSLETLVVPDEID